MDRATWVWKVSQQIPLMSLFPRLWMISGRN